MWEQVKKLFDNEIFITIGAIWATVSNFLFPSSTIYTAAMAVLGIMALDLLTKLFALVRQSGGVKKAFKCRKITSAKFAKGTLDKLIIFGVMLIISGCAYNLIIIEEVATWFTQIVFTVMFLRDALSILENLNDAGVSGLGLFKKVINKKIEEYVDPDPCEDDKPKGE